MTLAELREPDALAERLAAAGLAAARVTRVLADLRTCGEALRAIGVDRGAAAHALVVPGRIEVLGKHTDYAGGRSLLAAAERGFTAVAIARDDGDVRVLDSARDEMVRFPLDPALAPAAGWANYPMTAARRMARDFSTVRTGADIAFTSDLPPAAGMSSSSAFIVTTFLALAAVNRLEDDPAYRSAIASAEDLAGYLAAVENGQGFRTLAGDAGVGTHGGSEDHTALLCARPGRLVQFSFAPVRFERALPMPAGHGFVIASSGVHAEKSGAARVRYNGAVELMRIAAALWREATGRAEQTAGAVLDAGPDAADRLRALLLAGQRADATAEALVERFDQFVEESREIVPAAGAALERDDLTAFGMLVDRSQALAERLLRNQIDETVHLTRSARDFGASAASAFGAGFGGSVWALVDDASAEEFLARWREEYVARFPALGGEALFFRTGAGAAATRVS